MAKSRNRPKERTLRYAIMVIIIDVFLDSCKLTMPQTIIKQNVSRQRISLAALRPRCMSKAGRICETCRLADGPACA